MFDLESEQLLKLLEYNSNLVGFMIKLIYMKILLITITLVGLVVGAIILTYLGVTSTTFNVSSPVSENSIEPSEVDQLPSVSENSKDTWELLVEQKVDNRQILAREDIKLAMAHGQVSPLSVGIVDPSLQCTWGSARHPYPPEVDAPREHQYLANCYTLYEGKAYYDRDVIVGADGNTFEMVPGDGRFARDKDRIYYSGEFIGAEIIDTDTFVALNEKYMKDKNFVYYLNENIDEGSRVALLEIVERADPDTFVVVGRHAKDKNYIFLSNKILHGVNPSTFQDMGERNFKDKDNAYSPSGNIIEGVNLSTLEDVPGGAGFYIKDKDHIFFSDYSYSYDFKIIEGADLETFELIGKNPWMGEYAIDSHFVYFGSRKIDAADWESFVVMPDGNYAKDKNHTYFWGNIEK